jgi:hypothetical protein
VGPAGGLLRAADPCGVAEEPPAPGVVWGVSVGVAADGTAGAAAEAESMDVRLRVIASCPRRRVACGRARERRVAEDRRALSAVIATWRASASSSGAICPVMARMLV